MWRRLISIRCVEKYVGTRICRAFPSGTILLSRNLRGSCLVGRSRFRWYTKTGSVVVVVGVQVELEYH